MTGFQDLPVELCVQILSHALLSSNNGKYFRFTGFDVPAPDPAHTKIVPSQLLRTALTLAATSTALRSATIGFMRTYKDFMKQWLYKSRKIEASIEVSRRQAREIFENRMRSCLGWIVVGSARERENLLEWIARQCFPEDEAVYRLCYQIAPITTQNYVRFSRLYAKIASINHNVDDEMRMIDEVVGRWAKTNSTFNSSIITPDMNAGLNSGTFPDLLDLSKHHDHIEDKSAEHHDYKMTRSCAEQLRQLYAELRGSDTSCNASANSLYHYVPTEDEARAAAAAYQTVVKKECLTRFDYPDEDDTIWIVPQRPVSEHIAAKKRIKAMFEERDESAGAV